MCMHVSKKNSTIFLKIMKDSSNCNKVLSKLMHSESEEMGNEIEEEMSKGW